MEATEPRPRKWDPLVRLTHWAVVAAVLANALVTEEGSNAHVWVGYGLAGMLGLRLLWGLIGPREARFSAFPPSLSKAVQHLRDIRAGRTIERASHNPLGALMVYAIWGTLGAIIATGILMAGIPDRGSATPAFDAPALSLPSKAAFYEAHEEAGEEGGGEEEGPLVEVHEAFVNILYVLILLHIGGVLFESRRSGRQIVMAMLPGRR